MPVLIVTNKLLLKMKTLIFFAWTNMVAIKRKASRHHNERTKLKKRSQYPSPSAFGKKKKKPQNICSFLWIFPFFFFLVIRLLSLLLKDMRRFQMKELLGVCIWNWLHNIDKRGFFPFSHAHTRHFTQAFVERQTGAIVCLSRSPATQKRTDGQELLLKLLINEHYRRKDKEFAASVKEPDTKHSTCQYWQDGDLKRSGDEKIKKQHNLKRIAHIVFLQAVRLD